ncbi:hypothetical protein EDD11_000486 [Mortierella claussenii]|nr:hypothetical protein EDD11_000486 [Mortierella claussenii]
MLNELSRMEMFVTRIEAVGKQDEAILELNKIITHLEQALHHFELENGNAAAVEHTLGRVLLQRYMIRTGLAEMFPKSAEYLGIDPVIPGGSFLEGKPKLCCVALQGGTTIEWAHLRQMSTINQLVSIALQLQNDLRLTNHKFIAHQVALLYQCINQAGSTYSKFKARVEEHFSTVKEVCNATEEPLLPPELQTWLTELTTDIIAEALYSGRILSQKTPENAHLSAFMNRVSSGNGWDEQTVEA